ncbi:MAG: glycerol-3-phosphate dehydrogenase [Burkholderiales bacterium]|nr:glycerol-3-phosphate dehydrogenase [Burkholderiales bacterium]
MTTVLPRTPASDDRPLDILVVGGGINGCGIARDAAGRGLDVMLVEMGDIAGATSQWSSKLIHGGLRYLEYYEFRLVRESLREREVLLRLAPHLIEPLQFVVPHAAHLRPRWMIRAGLFLYDALRGASALPRSRAVSLSGDGLGAALSARFTRGFCYYDAQADDARLTLANARGAADLGACIATRTRLVSARAEHGLWQVQLEDLLHGGVRRVAARAIVNAAGPWVGEVQGRIDGAHAGARIKHVKGSHIVVPRLHQGAYAYLLQNPDGRILFAIPWLDRYTLLGTTDVPVEDYAAPAIDAAEIDYLCARASEYFAVPVRKSDIVTTYAGVRPLYDDGAGEAAAVTRDYVLHVEDIGGAALLNVYGGKLTTYRKLSEQAMARLAGHFPAMGKSWTHAAPLPGGDFDGGRAEFAGELAGRFAWLPREHLDVLVRRHGTRAAQLLDGCGMPADLGEHFGAGFYARELEYMVANEWAVTADDLLMRRSKYGIILDAAQRERVTRHLEGMRS